MVRYIIILLFIYSPVIASNLDSNITSSIGSTDPNSTITSIKPNASAMNTKNISTSDSFSTFINIPNWLSSLLLSIFIALATSIITIRLSIHRFRSEQWWTRKAKTYEELLRSFHAAHVALDKILKALANPHLAGNSREQRLKQHAEWAKEHGTAIEPLNLMMSIGDIYLHRNVVKVMHRLYYILDILADNLDPSKYDYTTAVEIAALRTCKEYIIKIIPADLRLLSWYSRIIILCRSKPPTVKQLQETHTEEACKSYGISYKHEDKN